MLLRQGGGGPTEFQFQVSGTPVNLKVRKANGAGGAAASTFTLTGGMGSPQIALVTVNNGDLGILGPIIFWLEDGTNVIQGSIAGDVISASNFDYGFEQTQLPLALGLALANLDTQLAPLAIGVFQPTVRGAIGMAAANLDTQLAAIGPGLTAAGVRAAIGMAAANLDTQLAAIGPGLTAAGVRAAIGMAAANLDTQLAAIPNALLDQTNGVETAITVRQAIRAIAAALCGQATIAGGHSIFQAIGVPATQRIDATTPGSGNRSAVSLTL